MLEERMLLFKDWDWLWVHAFVRSPAVLLTVWQEISEVPVLLSVMTMALLHSNQMPSNLFELYAPWPV